MKFAFIAKHRGEEDVRIYSIEGHDVKFVLKEQYAQIQDELRQLRLDQEDPSRSKLANKLLAEHPYAQRALPEDFFSALDALPDSRYFSRFLLAAESNV